MKKLVSFFNDPLKLAFLLSFIYWFYLLLSCRMSIQFDAVEYQNLGKMIEQKGWLEYFRTGPHREPVYPALVAFSMKIEYLFGVSYQFIQIILQFFILFLTQVLTLRILKILKTGRLLSALVILYLGISPALVNSALSLFSEIVTYPLILSALLLIYGACLNLSGNKKNIFFLSLVCSLVFVLMALSKAIFELVTPLFVIFLLFFILFSGIRKYLNRALFFSVAFLAFFYASLFGYKMLNKFFNGSSVLRDSGARVLFTSANQRMEPLTRERLLTALTYIPGESICQSLFNEEKCRYWAFSNADRLASEKISRIQNSVPAGKLQEALILDAKKRIFQNPPQFALLSLIEGMKLFFWESTRIGFVIYPDWLEKIFSYGPVKNGLRLVVSFLTILSFFWLFVLFLKEIKGLNLSKDRRQFLFASICALFVLPFIICYSFFNTITRYALPIAPVYLIIIAYFLQNTKWLSKNKT